MLSKKVTRWRNSFFHRRCRYCSYCEYEKGVFGGYKCTAKDEKINAPWYSFGYKHNIDYLKPFCTLFEVKDAYEESKVFDNSIGGESWSWEGYSSTGPSG